jgi:methionine-rich copper-binding protein CopC
MSAAPTGRSRGIRLSPTIAAGLILSGLIVAAPAPAFAHNYLVASTPEEGSTLTELPEEFSVTTNEPMLDVSGEAGGFALQVRDEQGAYYGNGCLTVAGSTLSTPAALGDAGTYSVGWQVVSADGHTVDGEFTFTWDPAADFTAAAGAASAPECDEAGSGQGATAGSGQDAVDPQSDSTAAVSGTDLLWVLGTVVVVGAVLFGTLLLLTRRRGSGTRAG